MPWAVKLRLVPFDRIAGPESSVMVTGKPDDAVAFNLRMLVTTWPAMGAKAMVWLFFTWKVLVNAAAGSQSALPACAATTETWPGPVKVSVLPPVMRPGPDATLKLTGR